MFVSNVREKSEKTHVNDKKTVCIEQNFREEKSVLDNDIQFLCDCTTVVAQLKIVNLCISAQLSVVVCWDTFCTVEKNGQKKEKWSKRD